MKRALPETAGAQVLKIRVSQTVAYLRKSWVRIAALLVAAFVVHAPAIQGERIWDDTYLTRDNPFIKSPLLILETFRHYLFLDSFSAHYRPIQNISYMVDYFFWNTDTWGFHITNVVLHAASGVALYFLLRELFASLFRRASIPVRARLIRRASWLSTAAFCVAIVWVVHPVHSAAVDYISGRADSLAFLLSATGWLLFLRAQRTTRSIASALLYFLAAVAGLAALLSREIAAVWILLFITHLVFVEKKIPIQTRIWAIACSSLILAIYCGLRHLPQQRPPSALDLRQSAATRLVLMARSLGDYGGLMIFPLHLHMERTVEFDHNGAPGYDWRSAAAAQYLSILGLIVLVALVVTCARKNRGQPLRIFGAIWFTVAYLPISNIVQLNATAAEHWLYLPSVGFLIWLTGCMFQLPKPCRRLIPALAAIAVIALGLRSFIRSSDWANEETFYKRTFAAGSRSARVAINLGQIYANRAEYAKAENIFRAVLACNPGYPNAQNHLAGVLFNEGKIKEAEQLYADVEKNSAQTRKEYPHTWIGALNLAKLRHNAKDDQNALEILENTRRDYPQVWDLVAFQSEVLRQRGDVDLALQLVENFADKNWWHYGAALALGRLYAQKGDAECSELALRHASRLDVHETNALNLIATMRVRENRLAEAFTTQRRAVARQPDEPRQYILLSNILEKMGRAEEARAALAQVSHLRALAQNASVAN
ncbi:MAG TPA: tetratricopeptide repeat protein [Chthoniobacterales bacterium]